MHEQSRTINKNGKWVNVHGTTFDPLTPMFPFEKPEYNTEKEAVQAAVYRSFFFGTLVDQMQMRNDEFNRAMGKSNPNVQAIDESKGGF